MKEDKFLGVQYDCFKTGHGYKIFTLFTWLLIISYLFTYLISQSMEQSSSWEANRFSASQEILRNLWNPKVYHIQKYPPPVPILSHLDLIHTPTSQLLKIHLNVILPSMPGSSMWSHSLRLPHQNASVT